jgi:hypothetical protein
MNGSHELAATLQKYFSPEQAATLRKYFSPDQIAVLLTVHTNTVNRWLREGVRFSDGTRRRPEAIRTPGGWRVLEDDLFSWLEAVKLDRVSEPSAKG